MPPDAPSLRDQGSGGVSRGRTFERMLAGLDDDGRSSMPPAPSDQSENPVTWYVKATVTTRLKAHTQGEALQELCNRLHDGVLRNDYDVNTVDAERVSMPEPTVESEAAVDEMLRLAAPSWSEAKIRNGVETLRAHFSKPDNYLDAAWEVHLQEVAKLIFTLGAIGKERAA